jgi:hypothetical protein
MKVQLSQVMRLLTDALQKHPQAAGVLGELIQGVTDLSEKGKPRGGPGRNRIYPWELINFSLKNGDIATVWGVSYNQVAIRRTSERNQGNDPERLEAHTPEYARALNEERRKATEWRKNKELQKSIAKTLSPAQEEMVAVEA